jgi:Trk K+ transport system NAD-binding subunit
MGGTRGRTVVVKGCGKVGGTVARLLVAAGAKVLTIDVFPERADIPGW